MAQNLPRTGELLGSREWPADEDLAAARSIRDPRHRHGPRDAQIADMGERGNAGVVAVLGIGERVVDGRDQIIDDAVELLNERSGNVMRSRIDVDSRGRQVQTVLVLLADAVVDV